MSTPSLGRVLVELGQHAADVLCAVGSGLGAPVRRARIWDAADGELAVGDLVLAVGVVAASPQLSRLLVAAAESKVAAVAIRGPVNLTWVRAEAERLGVTVLVVSGELSWDHVHSRVRSSVAGAAGAGGGASDLSAVANTAAAALGGPVEIDDAQMRPLAFSTQPDTRMSLVTRPPAAEPGVLRRLRCADGPVRMGPPGGPARLVMPVRAGAEVLGYVWLAEGSEPLGRRHQRVLAGVARVVAVHLGRAGGPDRRPQRELLACALERGSDTVALASRLRLDPRTPFAVAGFRPRRTWADPAVDPLYVRDQLELRGELSTGGAAVVMGEHVYAVVPVGGGPVDLAGPAREVVTLIASQLGCDLVAVIGAAPALDGLAAVRDEVDRALRLLADDPDRSVATAAELRPRVVLGMVRELARERPELLAGPVQVLDEIDRTRRTDYLTTLRAYFDAASDLTEAARVLFVHRNTLRYRLRRIQELCGLDLSDPDERLVAELQLRLIDERPARAAAVEERASS